VLDIDSSCKAGRFVRSCDAFNVPRREPGPKRKHGNIPL
jgi:hypothetical protein